MPLVFIHGVNTRDNGPDSKYGKMKAEIEAHLKERVLAPRNQDMEVLFPNWGQFAVSFHWFEKGKGLLAVPDQGYLESVAEPRPALEQPSVGPLEAAEIELDEQALEELPASTRTELTNALRAALTAPEGSAAILNAESDLEAVALLEAQLALPALQSEQEGLMAAGAELIATVRERALRVVTATVIRHRRQAAQRNASRFMADAFVYARDRGTREQPGAIITEVVEALKVPREPGEPLIVVTHSMGGNILYDILTTYEPELVVDTWIAVGSQVGHFEDMKLFCASDRNIAHPDKVPKPANLKHWFNVLDRGDVIAFLAAPIFAGVQDVFYDTGASALTAHGAYFHQTAFYDLIRQLVDNPDAPLARQPSFLRRTASRGPR